MIPVQRPCIGDRELEAVRAVFATGWLGLGSESEQFEHELAALLGAKHVVAVNTGTSALHAALDAIEIGPGDEVVVPSLTFCASVQAITATGAKPVFCDVDSATLNMDIDDALSRVTRRTRAIMPVHYAGRPCDMDRLLPEAGLRGLRVVEDAAHAFGSRLDGRLGRFVWRRHLFQLRPDQEHHLCRGRGGGDRRRGARCHPAAQTQRRYYERGLAAVARRSTLAVPGHRSRVPLPPAQRERCHRACPADPS